MSAFENWKIVYQYEGFLQSIRRTFGFVYEKYIRPKLPSREPKYAKLNGVLASRADAKILDNYIGIINYEGPLIRGMNESIQKGDRVVIVGGGRGVSAVVAAKLAGPEGHVTVYEGAKSMLSHIEDTLAINNISNVEKIISFQKRFRCTMTTEVRVLFPRTNCRSVIHSCWTAKG